MGNTLVNALLNSFLSFVNLSPDNTINLADTAAIKNSYSLLKWIYRSRIFITLLIIAWSIVLLYFYNTEENDRKREKIKYTNSIVVSGLVLIGVVWIFSILIVMIVPSLKGVLLQFTKSLASK